MRIELENTIAKNEKQQEEGPPVGEEGEEIPEVDTDTKEETNDTFYYNPRKELKFGENSKIEINKKIASTFYVFDYSSGFKLTGDVGDISACQQREIEKN